MDIWTERLAVRHLPCLARWLDRADAALTENDLPSTAAELETWYAESAAEPGRLDCLVSVYETPVGLASLRRQSESAETAALSLLLGERGYNPSRTATYAALRMLDRAFLERGMVRVNIQICPGHPWFAEVLERMGFAPAATDGRTALAVAREDYMSRKHLF